MAEETTADDTTRGEVLVAKDTFVAYYDGAPRVINKGVTRVRAGHPIADEYPDMFEPVTVHYDTVEQATAAPGESRTTRRASKARKSTAGDA